MRCDGVHRSSMPLLKRSRCTGFLPVIMNASGVVRYISSAGRVDVGDVVRPDLELLAHVRPGEQLVETDEPLVGVDQRVSGEARVTGGDPAVVRGGVPAVDRGVELQTRIGALPRRLGDLAPQRACLHGAQHLAGRDGNEVPVGVVDDRLHELVGHPHRVVGVLVLHRERVGPVEAHVEAGVGEHPRLALLDRLRPDELFDVGVVGVEDHHLRRPPGLAARLDRAGGRIGPSHETHRSGGGATALERFVRRPDPRQVDAGTRAALEDQTLLAVPVEDRGHLVLDGEDEAGARLLRHAPHPDVEPDRAVERGALGDQDVLQLVAERSLLRRRRSSRPRCPTRRSCRRSGRRPA